MTDHPEDPFSVSRRRLLAGQLWLLADLSAVAEPRSFRARAFRTGAWAIDFLPDPFAATRREMLAVDGIGAAIADLVVEFAETGHMRRLDLLTEHFPVDSRRLISLPRMTPGRLRTLKTTLGVDTVQDLVDAVHTEAVETLEGIGAATGERWLEILALEPSPGALTAHEAAGRSARLRAHLRALLDAPCETLDSGAVRRLDEWASELDIVVITTDPATTRRRLNATAVARSSVSTDSGVRLELHDGITAAVTIAAHASAGSALLETTGPAGFVARFEPLGPYETESTAFESVGHRWIPAPARVRPGPVPLDLVTTGDLRGDLHVHSERSPDGRMTIDEILDRALERGYRYVAITDHTHGLGFGGLDRRGLEAQRTEIEAARRRFPELAVFHAAEINIDREGAPDVDDETLDMLDFVIAGCHSHFDLPVEEQTQRVVAAVSHPAVRVLAHPFGRRIGLRPGFELDFHAVIGAAIEHGTALEVNGHRDRMDLSDEHAAIAARAGALLAADSDAHRVDELDNVAVSVAILQRAHVSRTSIVNALPRVGFERWLRREGR